MLAMNYTTEFLNLEDVIVTEVKNIASQLHVSIELPRREHCCPGCGATTNRVHDYRMQTVKDIPLGRDTYLHLRKRRYACPHCGKRFAEHNTFLPRYYRMTSRLIMTIIDAFRKVLSASEIAARYNISTTTAIRYFDVVNYRCGKLPVVLSIDEFKGNAGGQKYQTILTDLEQKKVADILPNRYESDLIRYFKQFSSRTEVKYFVCDMNSHFREVAQTCFPNAVIVADRYHVVRQAVWAMENVRKNEQKNLSKQFRIYFKKSRYLLNKKRENLTEDEMFQLALMFEISPRLADAYRLKNEFVDIMRSESSEKGRQQLVDWLFSVETMDLPEFQDCTKAVHNWFREILNSLDCPWTNGFTEGCNNKIKVLKRTCYGMRNFKKFRNRILHCSIT